MLILLIVAGCRQSYLPPVSAKNYSYLVVDGFLAANDSSIIRLSRTVPISDSNLQRPEYGAQVTLTGDQGSVFLIPPVIGSDGKYATATLPLSPSEHYTLTVQTTDGKTYATDPLQMKIAPAVDSLNWDQPIPGTVNVYVTTHDPSNNTRYYRWDYVETWQYHTPWESSLEFENGALSLRPPQKQIYNCWQSQQSSNILIGSSLKLANDVIFRNPLVQILNPDERLAVRYSILVNQYAITKEAFDYYHQLQSNSEQLGSIFGTTPSQLKGNVHSLSDPSEVVLGYIGAGSITHSRMFIDITQVQPWLAPPVYDLCKRYTVPLNELDHYFGTGIYIPIDYHYEGIALVGIYGSDPYCVDCSARGGTSIKPSFWQ